MARSAGQARGLAKSNDCAVGLVDEKIAALEQIPEDAAEAMRIDAKESLDEAVGRLFLRAFDQRVNSRLNDVLAVAAD